MLKESLTIVTRPQANTENILFWRDYRVTVLGERLFRLEQSKNKKFRDCATQVVWYRDMEKQAFTFTQGEDFAVVDTGVCRLILNKERGQVCVELDGKRRPLDNSGNLLGTYRTLDDCNGDVHRNPWIEGEKPRRVRLETGVCSTSGVAVVEDSGSLSLDGRGSVRNEKADGTDEYIFAYGDDYRGAVRALYSITGNTPLVPRFALGNWWSRYHIYTDEEYLRLLSAFEERKIPLTVATLDMDWHYAAGIDEQLGLTKSGRGTKEYTGDYWAQIGWTGYTWNEKLFPDPADFLAQVKAKNLRVTLNLHPYDGVRFWEACYEEMAKEMGLDPAANKPVPFDFSSEKFINAYFDIMHRPHEKIGVDFWWIDWQQPAMLWQGQEGTSYDPLWALNHYHYLDNAEGRSTPLVLSRYAGVGSHRYPLGFSGDTLVTWETLAYLPYFTATASNIGYAWWSHDIGGHTSGEKKDELYLRHLQYGVFSPINRLHCSNADTVTKEPWAYGNGAGLLAEQALRLRHSMIPFLYTASYRTAKEGKALVEPLYYEWKTPQAYAYKEEYLFGDLLVAPVTGERLPDGYARINAWLPEGKWTDIFTGDEYEICEGGSERTLYRGLESIPVLIRAGGILPLSKDEGNGCDNPIRLEVWSYLGDGEYTLYEDGRESGKSGSFFTKFIARQTQTEGVCTHTLTISSEGDGEIIPKNRELSVKFKNVTELAKVRFFVDGKETKLAPWYTDCAAVRFDFEAGRTYRIEASFTPLTELEAWKARAKKVLTQAEGLNVDKQRAYKALLKTETKEEFLLALEPSPSLDYSPLSKITRLRLKETF